MPLYDFECPQCGHQEHNKLTAVGEPLRCPQCGEWLKRLLSTFGSYSIKGNNTASITPKKYRGEKP